MTLDELIDRTWSAMHVAPFRRAFLGSPAVSELVMLAVLHCPDASLRDARGRARVERDIVAEWERTVLDGFTLRRTKAYADAMARRGWAVWWNVCLPWGAFVVVRFVLELWKAGDVNIAAMHEACGWRTRTGSRSAG